MITSFIEMLELPNVTHMTTSTVWFKSYDNILFVTYRNYDAITFTSNRFILRGPGVPNFDDIIKTAVMFVKTIRKYVLKCNLDVAIISWYSKSCWFSVKKCWCQQIFKMYVT